MRLSRAYLVVVDISGYTRFITERSFALEHAEQIISDLITAVLDQSRDPLLVNKLEGDAALLFREVDHNDVDAARDVFEQVRAFFPAFQQRLATLRTARQNCSCEACTNITALDLKAFVHVGEIAIKQVRQFQELAGEPVILLHRMMKNSVNSHHYVLLTAAAAEQAKLNVEALTAHTESFDGFGSVAMWRCEPHALPSVQ